MKKPVRTTIVVERLGLIDFMQNNFMRSQAKGKGGGTDALQNAVGSVGEGLGNGKLKRGAN